MRVVLDTNVLVSALLWRGTPHRLLQRLEERHVALVTTPRMIQELREVLPRPKFVGRLHALNVSVDMLLDAVVEHTELFPDRAIAPVIREDPADDRVLAAAQTANASLIVSGDPHLLRLRAFAGIPIVTPRQALTQFPAG